MDVESARLEVTLEQILKDKGAHVADVRKVVQRRPAGVHLHFAPGRIERPKLLEPPRVGVVEADRHQMFG